MGLWLCVVHNILPGMPTGCNVSHTSTYSEVKLRLQCMNAIPCIFLSSYVHISPGATMSQGSSNMMTDKLYEEAFIIKYEWEQMLPHNPRKMSATCKAHFKYSVERF